MKARDMSCCAHFSFIDQFAPSPVPHFWRGSTPLAVIVGCELLFRLRMNGGRKLATRCGNGTDGTGNCDTVSVEIRPETSGETHSCGIAMSSALRSDTSSAPPPTTTMRYDTMFTASSDSSWRILYVTVRSLLCTAAVYTE